METIARERLSALFDGGVFTELDALRTENGEPAAVICAHGYVEGQAVCAFAQAPDINSGVMGKSTAGKIRRIFSLAAKTGTPLIGIYDSNGVYVDGTADSLTAYGKLIAASAKLSGVVPQIAVVAGVCAGSAALLAASADFVIASEKAELYLTPPFGTDAATPAVMAKAGVIAAVCADDAACAETVKSLLRRLPSNNLAGAPVSEFDEPETACTKDTLLTGIADADSLLPLYDAYGIGTRSVGRHHHHLQIRRCTHRGRFRENGTLCPHLRCVLDPGHHGRRYAGLCSGYRSGKNRFAPRNDAALRRLRRGYDRQDRTDRGRGLRRCILRDRGQRRRKRLCDRMEECGDRADASGGSRRVPLA